MTEALRKKATGMELGVYTVTCGKCGDRNYVHIDSEGDYDPVRCRSCKGGFQAIEEGERNNEYIAHVPEEEVPVLKEEPKEEPAPRGEAVKKEAGAVAVQVKTAKKRKVKLTSIKRRQGRQASRRG